MSASFVFLVVGVFALVQIALHRDALCRRQREEIRRLRCDIRYLESLLGQRQLPPSQRETPPLGVRAFRHGDPRHEYPEDKS